MGRYTHGKRFRGPNDNDGDDREHALSHERRTYTFHINSICTLLHMSLVAIKIASMMTIGPRTSTVQMFPPLEHVAPTSKR